MSPPNILFIDAYDSFSNNIVSLLSTTLDADVDILPIDPPGLDPRKPKFAEELINLLRCYDAVVCGPGPGSPTSALDVGLMRYIWDLEPAHLVPVLGICLGFQSLVVSCGGVVKKLETGLHGMIREIDHAAKQPGPHEGNIFCDVPPFKATLYHSLHADIGQESVPADDWVSSRWASPALLPDIIPLAWVYEDRGSHVERILMGMKHRTKPFWGLQYHPESICTEPTGHQVIRNWFRDAMRWNSANGRITDPNPSSLSAITKLPKFSVYSFDKDADDSAIERDSNDYRSWINGDSELASFGLNHCYGSKTLALPIHIEVPDIVEVLQGDRKEYIILDSASAKASRIGADVRGRYSIIALDVDEALKLEYRTGCRHVTAHCSYSHLSPPREVSESIQLGSRQTVWQLLAAFWARRKLAADGHSAPFLGGFMGYTTYELGLEGIDVKLHEERCHNRPDLCFAWITKSIVVDHTKGTIRIQCLSPSEPEGKLWAASIADKLSASAVWSEGARADLNKRAQLSQSTPPLSFKPLFAKAHIQVPDADEYESKVRSCQESIASGDSYELCLTDQTHITLPHRPPSQARILQKSPSWHLYRALRSRQPAPFGSYLRLGGATLVSSSPERFLEFGSGPESVCTMRPMKGTVRKSAATPTLAHARQLLHVPKEEAENLMIVDLVRHDLHAVCGPGRVRVPKLNVVEEYASVFQMISVVEGRLPPSPHQEEGQGIGKTGLDVLAASLPPGSMTGAPKKRSCEILHEIEGRRERSLYSGVVGYMDAAGRGDWSVTIRSLFRWDDEVTTATTATPTTTAAVGATAASNGQGQEQEQQVEVWHIGAGGAVTALSTPEGERDEMFTKLKGPLGVFADEAD
ncbi:para-aminobenzoate synthase [Hypoxylon sp. NC1633]|nr:para-aminobenzoate synthase [Hypoxylon sp. NC1633]